MAKRNEVTETATTETEVPTTETQAEASSLTVSYGDFSVSIDDLAPKGVAYLLQYGFAKSVQDSVAGMKKALKEEGKDEATVEAEVKAAMQDRVNAIIAGSVGTRGPAGPKASSLDRVMRSVATENVRAAAASRKFKIAKGQLEGLVDSYLAKYGEQVRAEAERRMASVSVEDDFLAGLVEETPAETEATDAA